MPNPIIEAQFMPVRLAAQFDSTDATLANLPGFTFDGIAGRTYEIDITFIYFLSGAADGIRFALSGTATFTGIRLIYELMDWSSATFFLVGAITAKDTAVTEAVSTIATVHIMGTVVIDAAGTVTFQAACNSNGAGTMSIVAGSVFEYKLAA